MKNEKPEMKTPVHLLLTISEVGKLDKEALRQNVSRTEIIRQFIKKLK